MNFLQFDARRNRLLLAGFLRPQYRTVETDASATDKEHEPQRDGNDARGHDLSLL